MNNEDIAKLRDLVSRFSTAVLLSRREDDSLRGRPMAVAEVDDAGVIWFFSSHESGKVHEIEHDSRVHLVFQKEHTLYLSVSGTGSISLDHGKIAQLWKEPFRVWFPKGTDDPHIALIGVAPHDAEFWDSQGWNKISYLLRSAKAYATGQTPEVKEGVEHGVLAP